MAGLLRARHTPGTDDLGKSCDQEQLPDNRLQHGDGLAGVSRRHQVPSRSWSM